MVDELKSLKLSTCFGAVPSQMFTGQTYYSNSACHRERINIGNLDMVEAQKVPQHSEHKTVGCTLGCWAFWRARNARIFTTKSGASSLQIMLSNTATEIEPWDTHCSEHAVTKLPLM